MAKSYGVPITLRQTPVRLTSHPATQLVTVYLVERGLILPPQPMDGKTNEIKAIPPVLEQLAKHGVVFAFDVLNTQKKSAHKSLSLATTTLAL